MEEAKTVEGSAVTACRNRGRCRNVDSRACHFQSLGPGRAFPRQMGRGNVEGDAVANSRENFPVAGNGISIAREASEGAPDAVASCGDTGRGNGETALGRSQYVASSRPVSAAAVRRTAAVDARRVVVRIAC